MDKKVITIIDYKMGNVRSVAKAFEAIGCSALISNRIEDIVKSSFLVLPGVGAFGEGMRYIAELGLMEPLREQVVNKKTPFLGICLGMQLLARDGYENGYHKGLGWIDGSVKRFTFDDEKLKIPHMGWNDIDITYNNPLLSGITDDKTFYFVHSYHLVCDDPKICIASSFYGYDFTAAIQSDNIFATQFHPEKSQKAGLKVLRNFINYKD